MFITSPKLRRSAFTAALVILAPIIAGIAYLGVQYAGGNFHEVEAGQLYRSGQLGPAGFRGYVERYGIRTIINLRGENDNSTWYREEIAAAKALGVNHVDFKMSASRATPIGRVDELERLLRNVAKPVLIHCQAGADRSGLASAVFMHRIRGLDIEQAEQQISLYYGHIGIPYVSKAYPIDETWEKLEDIYRARERQARL